MTQNRQLAQYVLPTYRKHIKDVKRQLQPQSPRKAQTELLWGLPQLREAFAAICTQTATRANMILFIDGLDEHSEPGQKTTVSHNELLDVLAAMTSTSGHNNVVTLKLCLASRSEPVFVSRLHACPGFAMHMYTSGDIHTYISTRLRNQLSGENRRLKKATIDLITKTLLDRAHGIFIWVRLAVDEIIQGLQEEASNDELHEICCEIPPDLDDLYRRTIERSRSSWSGAAAKRRDQRVLQMHLIFAMALSKVTNNTEYLYDFQEMVQHITSFFLPETPHGTAVNPTNPLYVQIAESGAPRVVSFKETAEKLTPDIKSQALFIASRSGGLVELSEKDERRKRVSISFNKFHTPNSQRLHSNYSRTNCGS